jgi:folylpolyglutamate synthase/dihydropteroate synthase
MPPKSNSKSASTKTKKNKVVAEIVRNAEEEEEAKTTNVKWSKEMVVDLLEMRFVTSGSYGKRFLTARNNIEVGKAWEILAMSFNIANAFMAFGSVTFSRYSCQQHVNSGIENYRQEGRTSIMEYNEDNQPRFLKGIDSYHDLGKSDEVLNSLIMIKECFLINKLKKNFTPENEATVAPLTRQEGIG